MKFFIAFENTNDQILFDALNPDVVEYYINSINQHGINRFFCNNPNLGKNIANKTAEVEVVLESVNQWFEPLTKQKFVNQYSDSWLDQRALNKLHADWVNSQSLVYDIDKGRIESGHSELAEHIHDMYPDDIRFPGLFDIVNKLGKTKEFLYVNDSLVHVIEMMFNKIQFAADIDWIEIQNVFPKTLVTNNICNIFLPFHHLGRTQYNKFITFDTDLEFDDENTFNELLKFVEINLAAPQTVPYSQEYINWCQHHNREPSGGIGIPLGNIPDLFLNLTKYRKMLMNNLLSNNAFTLKIH